MVANINIITVIYANNVHKLRNRNQGSEVYNALNIITKFLILFIVTLTGICRSPLPITMCVLFVDRRRNCVS